ncbi:MAG: hypothetical protein J6B45_03970 [Clostridia bacterium]|nr:hypothetical protein [Clostridia bacterium]
MFTKYNNLNIPKNYSGNRFKQPTQDMGMKTHRAQETAPKSMVKTSVSPYAHEIFEQSHKSVEETEELIYNDQLETNEEKISEEIIHTPLEKTENCDSNIKDKPLAEKGITHIFDNIKNDDLLLLSLILLLAKDNTEGGFDAIAILALLLMY